MSSSALLCYNKGCGQKFDPVENTDDACKHHPGVPVFHDALKGWSCCKKRSTDFTEFLNIPGCTLGKHTNVKPPEPEKTQTEDSGDQVVSHKEEIVKPAEPLERPSDNEPTQKLEVNVASTLQQALEKHFKSISLEQEQTEVDSSLLKVGTACKNASCRGEYKDESSNSETCIYHPGVPIFHEGMKYWSCCKRKTSDFNTFLSQEGCETGKHLWFKKESTEKKVACRFDWHQTGTFVTISIFSKVAMPDKSWVEVNKVSAKINIVFEGGKSHFVKELKLFGVIDPERSNMKMMGTKVEINLRKMEPVKWAKLEYQEKQS